MGGPAGPGRTEEARTGALEFFQLFDLFEVFALFELFELFADNAIIQMIPISYNRRRHF